MIRKTIRKATRKSMTSMLTAAALALLANAAVGQESPAPAQPPATTSPAPAPSRATPPAAQRTTPPPAPSASAPPPGGEVRGDEFIPSQELQADEEATFPVDI